MSPANDPAYLANFGYRTISIGDLLRRWEEKTRRNCRFNFVIVWRTRAVGGCLPLLCTITLALDSAISSLWLETLEREERIAGCIWFLKTLLLGGARTTNDYKTCRCVNAILEAVAWSGAFQSSCLLIKRPIHSSDSLATIYHSV